MLTRQSWKRYWTESFVFSRRANEKRSLLSLSLCLALPLDTKSNWIFWCEREKSGRSIWQTRKEWRHTQNVLAYFLFRFGAILLSLSQPRLSTWTQSQTGFFEAKKICVWGQKHVANRWVQSYKTFYSSVKCYCLYLNLRIQAGYGLMEWAPFL